MTQKQLLVKVMQMVIDSGVCPDTKVSEWPKIILFAHTKGFLYMSPDQKTFVCAYRTNDLSDTSTMPNDESGEHLYVAWAVSESSEKSSLLKVMRSYLKNNRVKDIFYHRRNSDKDLKVLNMKGSQNGK